MSTIVTHSPYHASPTKSTLSEQLDSQNNGETTPRSSRFASTASTPKPRSLSDATKPVLSPSPSFREPSRRVSKDDTALESPTTPRNPQFSTRGLSLSMPSKDGLPEAHASPLSRVPLSPKLEAAHIYGSPASNIPRRSRGLDYTRACTNLHLSTLAESSPDASPVTGRGMQIPQRRSLVGSTVLDSPSNTSGHLWSTIPEKSTLSSSVSSVNMLDSNSDTDSSSDNEMAIDREDNDFMYSTPAASRLKSNLMGAAINSPGTEWMNRPQPSPAQSSLMNFSSSIMSFRKARSRRGKSHNSSSSVSMRSSRPSPGPLSPGVVKSVEGNNYFGTGLTRQQVQSRRESLSLGTDDLRLSDGEEGPSKTNGSHAHSDLDAEGPRGVIRRAVTRRGNLLPKTKGFARIKAALIEEAAPVEHETRREAEVIKQVQDNDPSFSPPQMAAESITRSIEEPVSTPSLESSKAPLTFSQHAAQNRNAGLGFWNTNTFNSDERYRTPPPSLLPRDSSSALSDELMETPLSSLNTTSNESNPLFRNFQRSRSRSTTPLAAAPTAGDVARRVNNKRRRDDDFDIGDYVKRRAVSPGMSVHSSPVLPQSPVAANGEKSWGKLPPFKNHGTGNGERSNSGGSQSMNAPHGVNGGSRRIGMQGMNDTNDGIMSMSIE